jgi:hypothetical protein
LFAPGDVVDGTTEGDVDIYGHDSYPVCLSYFSPTWHRTRILVITLEYNYRSSTNYSISGSWDLTVLSLIHGPLDRFRPTSMRLMRSRVLQHFTLLMSSKAAHLILGVDW